MITLIDYLTSLNTTENQWSLFINPENISEYRIGQNCFENGGFKDGWVKINSLDNLSFGFQSTTEAIKCYLNECNGILNYKGGKVRFNQKGLLEAYSSGYLYSEFQSFLESQADNITEKWSNDEASLWVTDVLPVILESKVEKKANFLDHIDWTSQQDPESI